jgi:predicted RNase H-like HicB family nuclease
MDKEIIKVPVILQHYPGDKNWSAEVPSLEGCLAEGKTPEEASEAIVGVILDFVGRDSALIENLVGKPELLVTEVEVPIERK